MGEHWPLVARLQGINMVVFHALYVFIFGPPGRYQDPLLIYGFPVSRENRTMTAWGSFFITFTLIFRTPCDRQVLRRPFEAIETGSCSRVVVFGRPVYFDVADSGPKCPPRLSALKL